MLTLWKHYEIKCDLIGLSPKRAGVDYYIKGKYGLFDIDLDLLILGSTCIQK